MSFNGVDKCLLRPARTCELAGLRKCLARRRDDVRSMRHAAWITYAPRSPEQRRTTGAIPPAHH